MSGGTGKNQQRSNFRRVQSFHEGTSESKFKSDQTTKKNNRSGRSSRNKGGKYIDNDVCEEEFNEREFCIICADKLQYAALSPCNHRTCHRCSFRQRALFNKNTCLVCRSEVDRIIFTEMLDAKFDDFKDEFAEVNEEYGINFTSSKVASHTLDLLKFRCNICVGEAYENQNRDYGSFSRYKGHLRDQHNRTICMICAMFKKAFPSELKVYTPNQLRNHQSRGDVEGFKGHPMCGYCSGRRFYSDDELYLHMRDQHEKCHICDRINSSQPQYFKDYDQLFEHFKSAHYICSVPSCLDDKFVVFRDEFELQAHILGQHGDIIRGKPKLFQSELSTFISTPSRVIREEGMNSVIKRDNNTRADDSSRISQLASIRLEERAKHYLNGAVDALEIFKNLNRKFDKGRLSADGLLDAYNDLFKSPIADVYLLIRNLAETYPSQSVNFRTLDAIYQKHERELNRAALPSLSTDPGIAPVANGVWSTNNKHAVLSHSGRINRMNLPSLQSPSPSHDIFATAPYKSAPHKNLNSSKMFPQTPTTVVRTASLNNNANWKPTYLDRKREPKSNSPSSSSPSLHSNRLAELDLPSLPTRKPNVYIPPVNRNPLPDPKQWGKNTPSQQLSRDPLDELLTNDTTTSKNKRKDKRKQLLFHIGI